MSIVVSAIIVADDSVIASDDPWDDMKKDDSVEAATDASARAFVVVGVAVDVVMESSVVDSCNEDSLSIPSFLAGTRKSKAVSSSSSTATESASRPSEGTPIPISDLFCTGSLPNKAIMYTASELAS